MTLESLVNEIKNISTHLEKIIEKPNDSFNSRNTLDQILRHEYPVETAASSYLDVSYDSSMNELSKRYIGRKRTEAIAVVRNDLNNSLARLDENSLADIAYKIDDKYKKLISAAEDSNKISAFIKEYAGNNADICFANIRTNKDFEKTYLAVLQVEKQAIDEREGFVSEDGKKIKGVIKAYILDTISRSEDREKDRIYSDIVGAYLK